MSRICVVATAGAGGDLQPLISLAEKLRERGHEVVFAGDESVRRTMHPLGVAVNVLPAELDLGPRLVAAVRDAMTTTGGDLSAAGPLVRDRMTAWAREMVAPVQGFVREHTPDVVLTSLFGVEVLNESQIAEPWGVVNSTFYVGPNPPRPLEKDFGPRAIPLIAQYAAMLDNASIVLHATDHIFDFSFNGLPANHRYVGPLGIWEPPTSAPEFLDAPGDPWVLVSISSQMQDDIALAAAAVAALADKPVRTILTVGPDHDPSEIAEPPANARIMRTISHAAVLQRGRLLVGHAGHGSVMKSLWHGKPMVLVPWGRDQPGVAARAHMLGVAQVVDRENARPETISLATDAILGNSEMEERARLHAERLQATTPATTAAEFVESLI